MKSLRIRGNYRNNDIVYRVERNDKAEITTNLSKMIDRLIVENEEKE